MKFNNSFSSFAQIRAIRGQIFLYSLGALGVLGGSTRATLRFPAGKNGADCLFAGFGLG
jgi:hypothetical protein